MGLRQKGIMAFALFFLAIGFSGCKTVPQPSTADPTPTPTGQVKLENNPFTVLLVKQMDAKDMLLGQMAERLDTYKPKSGETDYTGLAKTALVPFTQADTLLADVLQVSMTMQKQPDGSYAQNAGTKQVSLKLAGEQMSYAAKVTDSSNPNIYTRQSALYLPDGSRMTLQVFDKAQNRGEITTINLQWIIEGTATRMQYYYTLDDGDTYDILRLELSSGTLTFAVYEQVKTMPILATLPAKDFFQAGYITRGTLSNNTVTVVNDNRTLTVGP